MITHFLRKYKEAKILKLDERLSGGDGSGGGKVICRPRFALEAKMKTLKLITLVIVLIFAGCSIKKKQEIYKTTNGLEALKVLPDSDNDGIPDELEVLMGTNPYVADIPKISIGLVQDISIGAIFKPTVESFMENKFSLLRQEFSEIEGTKGGDIDSLKVLRRKVVKNQYNHLRNVKAEKVDIITNEDLRSNILSSWTDDLYYPFMDSISRIDSSLSNDSGKFIANLKIKISSGTNVTEISDISLKSFFYDYEKMEESEIYNHYLLKSSGSKERFKLAGNESYSPVTIYPLIANELKSNDVYAKIIDRSEIGIKFTDYSYTASGIQLSYAEVMNKVFDGDAKVVYSDGIKTEVFFVSPSLTVGDALKIEGKNIKLNKDGDIYSINGIETTAKYPIDVDTLRIDDMKKGMWSVFGDGDSLTEQMKPQGLYVVSYSTTKDILNVSRNWSTIEEPQLVDYIKLDNIYEGDEVLFDVKGMSVTSITETSSQETREDHCPASCTQFTGGGGGPPGSGCGHCRSCTTTVAAPTTVENSMNIPSDQLARWFSISGSDEEKIDARFFKYGNKIKIIFNSLQSHLSNSVKISLKSPTNATSSARSGVVSNTCGGSSYANQIFNNIYKINGTVKIFGINKY